MVQQQEKQEEIRKGPWTEQEDIQLLGFVGLFGDRRWDFIAKVSGLNRTGKSCRLRWVNYLHPGLKRGKMTPQEERLVLDLHAKWGNRWSRIARKLPGRTDNEIKNYWRTHMRKKAQEKKRFSPNKDNKPPPPPPPQSSSSSSTSSSSSSSASSASSNITTVEALPFPDSTTGVESFYDTGGLLNKPALSTPPAESFYSMDDIWKEISLPSATPVETPPMLYGADDEMMYLCNNVVGATWDQDQFYCSDSLWNMDDDKAMITTTNNQFYFSGFEYGLTTTTLTGS